MNSELGTSCKLAPAEGCELHGRLWGLVRVRAAWAIMGTCESASRTGRFLGLVRQVRQVGLVRVMLLKNFGKLLKFAKGGSAQVGLVGLVGNDKKVKKVNNLTKYKKYEYYSKRACTSDFGLAW